METTDATPTQQPTVHTPPAPPAQPAAPSPTPRATAASGVTVTDVDGNPIEHDGNPQIGRPVSKGDGSSMQLRALGQIERLEKQARMTIDQVRGAVVGDFTALNDADNLISQAIGKLRGSLA